MRYLWLFLAGCIALPLPRAAFAQVPVHQLNLVIVEGDGAINNLRQRTARETIVQVEDENHKPVAGAAVIFLLPSRGAGGTFADGSHSLTVVTDSQGRAVVHGLRPNSIKGPYQIQVTASYNGLTAAGTIAQSNELAAAGAGSGAAVAAGISGKIIAIVVVAAAAVAGGTYYATHSGGSSTPASATAAGTTITAGTGTVGPPR